MSNPPYGLRHVARCFILIAEIALWLLRSQSDCGDCTLIAEIAKVPQLTYGATTLHKDSGMLRGVLFWLQRLQSDCWDCSLIAEIAVQLLRLQSDCWDCSLIAEIAVRLLRLQSDCWDCKSSATYIYMSQPSTRCQAAISTMELQSIQSDCNAWGLQSECWDCSLIAYIAVWLLILQKFRNLLIHIPAPNKVSGKMLGVLF